MYKLIISILKNEQATTLSITRKTANTLATASGMNTNYDEIEAVVNALTADNFSADSVTATKLNSDVVRDDYGLVQHTDGSLYVDVSDTNPGLELEDGGLRVKVDDSTIQRASGGIEVIQPGLDHGSIGGLDDDDHTNYLTTGRHDTTTRHGSSVVDHGSIGGLTDNDHPQYIRGQANSYRIDTGVTSSIAGKGTTSVTFNTPFSSTPIVLVAAIDWKYSGEEDQGAGMITVGNRSTTGCTIGNTDEQAKAAVWIAIGPAS